VPQSKRKPQYCTLERKLWKKTQVLESICNLKNELNVKLIASAMLVYLIQIGSPSYKARSEPNLQSNKKEGYLIFKFNYSHIY
jgi:hypothetical protein